MASDAMDRYDQVSHAIGALARRAALIVACLAAFLAVAEVLQENSVKSVITGEVRVVREVGLDRAHATQRLPDVDATIAKDETRHSRYELATVLLEVGIVLSSASALVGIVWLLGGGALIGLVGIGFLLAGLLA